MLAGAVLVLNVVGAQCPAAPWDDMLALAPKQSTMAIWTDLLQARSSALVRRVQADARWRTLAGCEMQADELLLALDEEGPLAWVLRGGEAARLTRCGDLHVVRADKNTVVLAPDRAMRRLPGATRPRARVARTALSRLLCQAPRGRTVAFAARLGPQARKRLDRMPALKDAGTLRSVVGGADLRDGLMLTMHARLGSRGAAARVVQGIERELDAWRRQPLFALAGLSPLLSGVRASAQGDTTKIEANLGEAALLRLWDGMDALARTSARP